MKKYTNILCATDFSEASKEAAEQAIAIAKFYSAKLSLLHVIEYFPENRPNEFIPPEGADQKVFREKLARDAFVKLVQSLNLNAIKQDVLFSTQSAKNGIISYAEEQNIDLIVVGTHGHHGIRALLGSTANGVVHSAPCSVLVVRT